MRRYILRARCRAQRPERLCASLSKSSTRQEDHSQQLQRVGDALKRAIPDTLGAGRVRLCFCSSDPEQANLLLPPAISHS